MAIDPHLLSDCVHCGFCLPSCPTYALWAEEADSPRGRIHLMAQAVESGRFSGATATHIDACLGCLACVTACPSGVKYDRLIEQAREGVERDVRRPLAQRLFRSMLLRMLPSRRRLAFVRAASVLYDRLGVRRVLRGSSLLDYLPPVSALDALLPPIRPTESIPARTPALGPPRASVGLLVGCVQQTFFSHVNAATVRVLAAEGCTVIAPPGQGCCGALEVHAGQRERARRRARALIDTFDRTGTARIVVNAAGCGAVMKEYGRLLGNDPAYRDRAAQFAARVRDLSEFLVELGAQAPRHPIRAVATYQDACHLLHAQGLKAPPRALLRGIPALELREPAEPEICCGSAGIYNLVEPDAGRALADRKASVLNATGSGIVVTGNPGCLLQLRAAFDRLDRRVQILHVAELLDASIRGVDVPLICDD